MTKSEIMNRARILVIEDETMMQSLYSDILDNFDVVSAVCGRDALKLIGAGKNYDLYIVDIGLPDCNGFDLVAKIRSHHLDSKVIVGTGYPIESLAHHIKLTNPNYVVSKPFMVRDFRNKVDELIHFS